MIDCGMFQGREEDRNYDPFGFDPAEVDYLLVTHAHLDHVGRIPKLIKEGFAGPIYATRATADLAEVILYDSAKIMKEDYLTRYKKHNEKAKRSRSALLFMKRRMLMRHLTVSGIILSMIHLLISLMRSK